MSRLETYMDVPRIRGVTGQATAPPEVAGKYFFTISLWTFDGETQLGEPIGPFGPFETDAIAKEKMRAACKLAAEEWEKETTGKLSGKFLDMKNGGVMRRWDEN